MCIINVFGDWANVFLVQGRDDDLSRNIVNVGKPNKYRITNHVVYDPQRVGGMR